MEVYSIAEGKECCHAPLASFNVRLADGTSSAAAMPRRKNTSCWIGPHSRPEGWSISTQPFR